MKLVRILSVLSLAVFAGCAAYRWRSDIPDAKRTVSVPTFRNTTKVTELGAVATTQLLREIQRNGTFKIAHADDAAIEIQGEITGASLTGMRAMRRIQNRRVQGDFIVLAKISVIDRAEGKVIIDNRLYEGRTILSTDYDSMTAQRDASGRACDDLAQKIVDDLNGFSWRKSK